MLPKTIAIDSLRLKVPLDNVKILDDNLNRLIGTINLDTGELLSSEPDKRLKQIKSKGEIPTTFVIKEQINSKRQKEISGKEKQTFLSIALNSKHLRSNYFQGINKTNIKALYDSLMNEKVVYISYNDFINSELTDTDFKKDVQTDNYNLFLEHIKRTQRYFAEYGKGIRVFNKKENQGFQFSDRKGSTNTNPYIKVYNKNLQMERHNSVGGMLHFSQKYLKPLSAQYYRIEFTVKNKKMFDFYELPNNLKDLLEVPQEHLKSILDRILNYHINPQRQQMNITRTNVNDISMELLIESYYNQGMTINELIDDYKTAIKSRTTFQRNKEKLIEIYQGRKNKKYENVELGKAVFDKFFN